MTHPGRYTELRRPGRHDRGARWHVALHAFRAAAAHTVPPQVGGASSCAHPLYREVCVKSLGMSA